MFNFGFAVEQALGHITHYQNLNRWVAEDSDIYPTWMPIKGGVDDIWSRLPIVNNNWSLQASLRTRDTLKAALLSDSLDVLFLHTQTLALFAIPFMRRIPTIISTDATPLNYDTVGCAYNHKVGGHSLLENAKFLWNQSTYHAASAIVTWCQWAKDSLVADYNVPRDKVIVIPPGIDLKQWRFEPKQKTVTGDRSSLLFVGGEFARKGGNTLLNAFRQGLSHDCTLDIVTKDTTVDRQIAEIEGVRVHYGLTAHSPQLQELYAQADIFVFPTQGDCFPYAVIEAMASGLPVIATNVGALREQVEDGIHGLIIPPNDASALISAVRALNYEPKRIAMATASRSKAEKCFDARRNYGAIFALMKSMSKRSTSSASKQKLYA